jgi:hypothetical protein
MISNRFLTILRLAAATSWLWLATVVMGQNQADFPINNDPVPQAGDFPALPPDPNEEGLAPLQPLADELYFHGGSYLYNAEGDRLNWPSDHEGAHYDRFRLPEGYLAPEPLTIFADFLGADPLAYHPHDDGGYSIEPRGVAYGRYSLFGFGYEENNVRRDAIGHNLQVEVDLQLTGTERFHAQFLPLGPAGSGGSYYQFSNPSGYIDNSNADPSRYWFEGELHSMIGIDYDPFGALDWNYVAGKFPFALHNSLLMSDDIIGVVASKNTNFISNLSNVNIQWFYGANDVDAFPTSEAQLSGVHISADNHRDFYELTYAFVDHDQDPTRNSHYAAVSRTASWGPTTVATRAMFLWGDEGGTGDAQLFVLESNRTRHFEHHPFDIQYGVFYCNAFLATEGWRPISGGNLNRLRVNFEVNPLLRIAAAPSGLETWGVALGVQLFRDHEDESFIPEIAVEGPDGDTVLGLGLRYQRKTGPQSFLEILTIYNESNNPAYDRLGFFGGHTIIF